MTSLELLAIQAEGALDERRRVIGLYGVELASSDEGHALWIGDQVPEPLATALAAIAGAAPLVLEGCRRALGGALPCTSGPSFVFAANTRLGCAAPIHRSDTFSGGGWANPGNWEPVEWEELLDGKLGPWAIATEGELVVSICHTPRPMTARAAECGVWTRPGFRGRGLAAAVASEWAAILGSSGRHLFYSTDEENRSSQAVARRLGLRPLGRKWRVGAAPGGKVHPLSSLRG